VHQELTSRDLERIAAATRRPRARSAPLRLESLETLDTPDDEWVELAKQSGSVFATQEWISIWWRHFGRGRPLFVTACRAREGRLVAILPLYLWTDHPLRVVRFLGHGAGDELGPICAPSDRSAAASALRESLANAPWRWDVFLGEHLPADARWNAILGGRLLRRHGSPVLRFRASSWDAFLGSLSSNHRQQLRRRERRLSREHDVQYRLATDPGSLQDDLDTLFTLHTARWDGTTAFAGPREAFHREFAARALDRGWLRLWFLELDGRAVAAWYGLRFGGAECYYQAGRDPAWEHDSVGSVLLAHSIRASLEDAVDEYRFLRGDDQFKYRFATEDPGLETIGVARSLVGRAALAAGAATRSLHGFPKALRGPLDL
jgi:CelD/BcsL family acetyltransferase involved in cellulose biosynthesis